MPDQPVVTPAQTPEDIAKNNAEVAAKLANQDSAGHSSAGTPDEFAEVGSALDKAAAAKAKEREEAAAKAALEPAPDPVPDPDKPVDKPVVTPKADEDPDAAKKAEEAAAAAKAAEEAKKAADDRFKDAPQLPQGASVKSHEAFAAIKVKAAQELSAKEKEIADLKKVLAERDEKLKNPVPKELLSEVEELRQFRAKLDVEVDPKFKEFDKQIDAAREFCYAQLKKSPVVTDATIEAIKKEGGIDRIALGTLFEAIKDPTMQRIVEARVADIEQKKFEKEQAIDAAKSNITDYLKQRETDTQRAATAHIEGTKEQLTKLLDGEDFLKPKSDTEPGAKEHNAALSEYERDIKEALNDNSPLMRAVLIHGTVRLFHERKIHEAVKSERDTLKEEVKALNAKIDKIKASATTRLRESSAPTSGELPKAKDDSVIFTEKPGDALDRIAREIAAKRETAGVK